MQTAQCRLVNSPNSSIYNHTTVSNESDNIVLRQNPFTYLPQLTLATHFRSTSCLQIWSLLQFNYEVGTFLICFNRLCSITLPVFYYFKLLNREN